MLERLAGMDAPPSSGWSSSARPQVPARPPGALSLSGRGERSCQIYRLGTEALLSTTL
jgi:hypothetical protein